MQLRGTLYLVNLTVAQYPLLGHSLTCLYYYSLLILLLPLACLSIYITLHYIILYYIIYSFNLDNDDGVFQCSMADSVSIGTE